jgi:hypothetical protein
MVKNGVIGEVKYILSNFVEAIARLLWLIEAFLLESMVIESSFKYSNYIVLQNKILQ